MVDAYVKTDVGIQEELDLDEGLEEPEELDASEDAIEIPEPQDEGEEIELPEPEELEDKPLGQDWTEYLAGVQYPHEQVAVTREERTGESERDLTGTGFVTTVAYSDAEKQTATEFIPPKETIPLDQRQKELCEVKGAHLLADADTQRKFAAGGGFLPETEDGLQGHHEAAVMGHYHQGWSKGWKKSTRGAAGEWFDSHWEVQHMNELDRDPMVLRWTRHHNLQIPYRKWWGGQGRYEPDFLVEIAGGEKEIREVKGEHLFRDANTARKLMAGEAFC
ncbi:MAG: hypothetical protein QME60_04415 [Verrucomicrobiota bacterium]|nr:hypothetical protein [Verrucomicrobiota bacterium]